MWDLFNLTLKLFIHVNSSLKETAGAFPEFGVGLVPKKRAVVYMGTSPRADHGPGCVHLSQLEVPNFDTFSL